ncbi:hypothetical protein EXU30_05910 [Shewanella maritima]|uniref:Uncharacterized protein n=1 Tax=Shewanella maritima TaxID=2520507 RepID=A0A411PFA9_9GAMM|nr:hypothetical protein [Shewanella maritima]QBF82286.1 hypothetical protein EXU30_05910 [Shewanella maritima]
MKLNKISHALKGQGKSWQPRTAILLIALASALSSNAVADNTQTDIEVAAVTEQDASYLDFTASYKLTDYLSFSLKALNLLDEPQVMTRGNSTAIADYSRSGPKFFLGAKAKFQAICLTNNVDKGTLTVSCVFQHITL